MALTPTAYAIESSGSQNTNGVVTTTSRTYNAGELVVVKYANSGNAGGGTQAFSISNTNTAQSWTLAREVKTPNDTCPVALWYCVMSTTQAMTITASFNNGISQYGHIEVEVFTGFDSGDPVPSGNVFSGSNTTDPSQSITPGRAGDCLRMWVADYNATNTFAAIANCTLIDTQHDAVWMTSASIRSTTDPRPDTSSFTIGETDTAGVINWIAYEVKAEDPGSGWNTTGTGPRSVPVWGGGPLGAGSFGQYTRSTDAAGAPPTASDTVTFSDSVTAVMTKVAAASDTVTFSDSVTATMTLVVTASDTVTFSDSVTGGVSNPVTASDTVTFSDSVTATLTLVVTASDSVTFSDSVTAVVSAVATASDSVTFSDSVTAVNTPGGITATASDTVTFSDSVTATMTLVAAASDTVSFSDSVTAVMTKVATASDTVSFSDSVTATRLLVVAANDSVTFSDSVTAVMTKVASANDTVAFSDAVTASVTGPGFPSASDTVVFSDSVTATLTRAVVEQTRGSGGQRAARERQLRRERQMRLEIEMILTLVSSGALDE